MNQSLTGGTPETPVVGAKPRGNKEEELRESTTAESVWNHAPWSWLVSLKVGITLLAILTVASIIGTLIEPLSKAQALIFYTPWYKGLLIVLSINMICSTLRTLSRKVLPPLSTWIRRNPRFFESTTPSVSVPFTGGSQAVAETFRRHGFAVALEGNFGYGMKGRLGRWGAPISHVGMVVLLLSGFAASWMAREGTVIEREGYSTDKMHIAGKTAKDPGTDVPLGFDVTIDDFDTGYFPRTHIPSHYVSTITATKGNKVLYHGTVQVNHSPVIEGWTFHQTSFQEYPGARFQMKIDSDQLAKPVELNISPGQVREIPGAKGMTVELMMSSPLGWKISKNGNMVTQGTTSQGTSASYQFQVAVTDTKTGKSIGPLTLQLHQAIPLANGKDNSAPILVADQFQPDFVIDTGGKVGSRSDQLNNPALHVVLRKGDQEVATQWLFGRQDMKAMMHAAAGDYKFELMKVEPVKDNNTGADKDTKAATGWNVSIVKKVPLYVTFLTVSRNPLIPVIYAACGLMMIGLLIGFFVMRKEVWFRIVPGKEKLQIAAAYRYGREELDGSVRNIVKELTGVDVSPATKGK